MITNDNFITFANINITKADLAAAGIDLDQHTDYFFDEYLRENLFDHPAFKAIILSLHESFIEETQNDSCP